MSPSAIRAVMETVDDDIARCLRGSSIRDRLLCSAVDRKHAYLAQLAEDAKISVKRAREAIYGAPPRFAIELSLAPLQLVRPLDPTGTQFVATPRGEEAVRVRRARGTRFL